MGRNSDQINLKLIIWSTIHHLKHTIPVEKQGGGCIMLRGCFSSDGTGAFSNLDGIKYKLLRDKTF